MSKLITPSRKILISFSLVSNMESIFERSPKTANRLDCFEGMRAISMTWVILCHNFMNGNSVLHARNKEYTISISSSSEDNSLAFEPIKNGQFSVDTFLFIGATLLSYLLLKDLDKSNGWFHSKGLIRMFLFYVNRYLRITIPLALAIAVLVGVMPLTMTDSMGASVATNYEAYWCKNNWYRNLLYYNIWPRYNGEMDMGCMGHTWYLAFDMEWFLISPLVAYPLWLTKFGKGHKFLGILWWSVIFLFFLAANWIHVNHRDWINLDQTVLPPWNFAPWGTRSHCYMLGLLMGYVLHTTKGTNVKINRILNILLWLVTFTAGAAVVYGPYWHMTRSSLLVYLTWYRLTWGLCLSWLTFACVKGHGGPVNSFLSWGLWAPVSRVSFMTYLFHISLSWYYLASQTYSLDLSMWLMTEMFVAQLALDLAVGLLASLTLELPFGRIQKLIIQKILTPND